MTNFPEDLRLMMDVLVGGAPSTTAATGTRLGTRPPPFYVCDR